MFGACYTGDCWGCACSRFVLVYTQHSTMTSGGGTILYIAPLRIYIILKRNAPSVARPQESAWRRSLHWNSFVFLQNQQKAKKKKKSRCRCWTDGMRWKDISAFQLFIMQQMQSRHLTQINTIIITYASRGSLVYRSSVISIMPTHARARTYACRHLICHLCIYHGKSKWDLAQCPGGITKLWASPYWIVVWSGPDCVRPVPPFISANALSASIVSWRRLEGGEQGPGEGEGEGKRMKGRKARAETISSDGRDTGHIIMVEKRRAEERIRKHWLNGGDAWVDCDA